MRRDDDLKPLNYEEFQINAKNLFIKKVEAEASSLHNLLKDHQTSAIGFCGP